MVSLNASFPTATLLLGVVAWERDNLPIEIGKIEKEFIKTGSDQDKLILSIIVNQRVNDGGPVDNTIGITTNGRSLGDFECTPINWDRDTSSNLVECGIEIANPINDVNVDIILDYEFRVSISKNVNIKNDGSRA